MHETQQADAQNTTLRCVDGRVASHSGLATVNQLMHRWGEGCKTILCLSYILLRYCCLEACFVPFRSLAEADRRPPSRTLATQHCLCRGVTD